jgi:hypothetical protein
MTKREKTAFLLVALLLVPLAFLACREGSPSGGPPQGGAPPQGAVPPGAPPGGMFGPPPQPGQILPSPVQARLNLTPEQRKELEALQKDADSKLAEILTDEQKKQLHDMQQGFGRGPGGPPGGGFPPPGPRPEEPK